MYSLSPPHTYMHKPHTHTQALYTHLRRRSISVWWESLFIKTYMTFFMRSRREFMSFCQILGTPDVIFHLSNETSWTRASGCWIGLIKHTQRGHPVSSLNNICVRRGDLLSRRASAITCFKFIQVGGHTASCSVQPQVLWFGSQHQRFMSGDELWKPTEGYLLRIKAKGQTFSSGNLKQSEYLTTFIKKITYCLLLLSWWESGDKIREICNQRTAMDLNDNTSQPGSLKQQIDRELWDLKGFKSHPELTLFLLGSHVIQGMLLTSAFWAKFTITEPPALLADLMLS